MADKYINIGGHKLTTDKDVLYKHKTVSYGGDVECYKAGNVVTVVLNGFTTAPPASTDINIQIFDSTEEDWKPRSVAWAVVPGYGGWNNNYCCNLNPSGSLYFYTYSTATGISTSFTYISKG